MCELELQGEPEKGSLDVFYCFRVQLYSIACWNRVSCLLNVVIPEGGRDV